MYVLRCLSTCRVLKRKFGNDDLFTREAFVSIENMCLELIKRGSVVMLATLC